MLRLVVLESPYRGLNAEDTSKNLDYARKAVYDSLCREEAPIASHLLYTQEGILDDSIPVKRSQGILLGIAWTKVAEACVVYVDLGLSPGMSEGIMAAVIAGIPIEFRRIERN